MLPIFRRAQIHTTGIAIVANGRHYTYTELADASSAFALTLLNHGNDLNECRVAFMVDPGFDYVKVQWGIWKAGGIAVPLCTSHPLTSLRYVIEDTEAEIIVVSPQFESVLRALAEEKGLRFIVLGQETEIQTGKLPVVNIERRAMILYTSGTTNLPKGVVTTHANLEAQITTLIEAWEYSPNDSLLCILPLHHVHGIINVVNCTLWAGGCVEFLPEFSASQVINWFLKFTKSEDNGVFMAVPTIYFKLISYFETLTADQQKALTNAMQTFRLMVSGSAALPVSVMEKWAKVSGHTLLERYGMTEIGMALSNPYHDQRRAGFVGVPLPKVNVRLVNEQNKEVESGQAGEIQVKGPNVFSEYWRRPAATQESFTEDGWFKTGDVAVMEEGSYKILGRNSVDIIKSGGYKISALEIEEVLRTHPAIKDCSVVGVPNEEWGETVAAALIISSVIDLSELNQWMRERMPSYRVPRQYKIVDELPRNAMGKVTKNDLKKLWTS
ncbi:MAG: acyl-CoA synthetase [Spirosomataceae bacterium]